MLSGELVYLAGNLSDHMRGMQLLPAMQTSLTPCHTDAATDDTRCAQLHQLLSLLICDRKILSVRNSSVSILTYLSGFKP